MTPPQRLRLRALHGRARVTRRRGAQAQRCPGVRRDDGAPVTLIEDLPARCDRLYAELRPHAYRRVRRARNRPDDKASASPSSEPSRGPSVCATRSMRPRRALHEPLRALRDHRPWRLLRVRRGASRLARQRGSLPSRDRRPGFGRAPRRRRAGRARHHHADEGGPPAGALLDGRHLQPLLAPCSCAARFVRMGCLSSGGATTCSSCVASMSTRARSETCWPDSRAVTALWARRAARRDARLARGARGARANSACDTVAGWRAHPR